MSQHESTNPNQFREEVVERAVVHDDLRRKLDAINGKHEGLMRRNEQLLAWNDQMVLAHDHIVDMINGVLVSDHPWTAQQLETMLIVVKERLRLAEPEEEQPGLF